MESWRHNGLWHEHTCTLTKHVIGDGDLNGSQHSLVRLRATFHSLSGAVEPAVQMKLILLPFAQI